MAKKTKLEKDFEGILQILEQIGAEGVGDGAYASLKEAMKNPGNNTMLALLCELAKQTSITLEVMYRTIVVPKAQESDMFKYILETYNTSKSAKAVANI